MFIGVDLSEKNDTTVLTKKVAITHKCGHTKKRLLSAYSTCFETIGSFERQFEEKIKYFSSLNCASCRCFQKKCLNN